MSAPARSGASDLLLALAVLSETPHPSHRAVAGALDLGALPEPAEYTQVLGMSVLPFASIYLGPEGMLGGEAADRVAGFWRAVGQTTPADADHLASLLGLYAALADAEAAEVDPARAALRRRARATLLWEHLLSWVPVFARAVEASGSAFYADWAALLVEALLGEAAELDPVEDLPRHLAEAPGLPDEIDGARDLARSLLTPVRSGVVLTRHDLARGARGLRLGMRVGERAFILASMLEQDAPATLDWFAAEAGRWADRHRQDAAMLGSVSSFWASRAEDTAAACRARQTTLQEVLADVV